MMIESLMHVIAFYPTTVDLLQFIMTHVPFGEELRYTSSEITEAYASFSNNMHCVIPSTHHGSAERLVRTAFEIRNACV